MTRRNTPATSGFASALRAALENLAAVAVKEYATLGPAEEGELQACIVAGLLDEATTLLDVYGPTTNEPCDYRDAVSRLTEVIAARAKSNPTGRLTDHDAELVASYARQTGEAVG